MQNILTIILFVTISPTLFIDVWTSVFFGFYLWTWMMLLTQRQQLFPMFRVFYIIHHTITFFITGAWIIVNPWYSEDDNYFIYRACVIWLSTDIWNSSLRISYRSLRPNTDKTIIRNMKTIAFGLERIHRLAGGLFAAPDCPSFTLQYSDVGSPGYPGLSRCCRCLVSAAFFMQALPREEQQKELEE